MDLIVLALQEGHAGAVVVPSVRAMKIVDVARAATEDDVEVEIIGERPGEKQHELLMHYEADEVTQPEDVMKRLAEVKQAIVAAQVDLASEAGDSIASGVRGLWLRGGF